MEALLPARERHVQQETQLDQKLVNFSKTKKKETVVIRYW